MIGASRVLVPGWDTEEDAVKLLEDGGVFDDGDIGSLGRRVHLLEDFLREGLLDSGGVVSMRNKGGAEVHTGRAWHHRQPPGYPSAQHRPDISVSLGYFGIIGIGGVRQGTSPRP